MTITPQIVADHIAAYLHQQWTLDELVNWAEQQMMDGEFDHDSAQPVRDVVARLGVADVRAFGLSWEDCQNLLDQLGFSAKVEIVAS